MTRDRRLRLWAAGLLVPVAVLLLGAWAGWLVRLPMTCPLRRFTGWPCATCGMTRAVSALSRGRLIEAMAWNVMVLPTALLGLAFLGCCVGQAATGRPMLAVAWRRHRRWLVPVCVGLALASLVINLVRHSQGGAV